MDTVKNNPIKKFLVPQYNELVLFLMSMSFVLAYLSYPGLRSEVYHFIFDDFNLSGFIFILFVASGMVVSMLHVFTQRKMNNFEKNLALIFVVVVNAYVGISAAIYQFSGTHGWYDIFPIWNLLNALLLLVMYKYDIVDESCIIDGKPSILQTVIGSVVVISTLIICQYVYQVTWIIALSLCMTYACNVNNVVQHIFASD